MTRRPVVRALIGAILLLGTVLLGLLARTAPVTRQDLQVDRIAQHLRFPAATDLFLGLTAAASEIVGISVLLIGVAVLIGRGRRWDALRLLATAGLGWTLAIGVKDLVARSRPPASLWALTPDSSGSFPSGHDTTACIVVVVAFLVLRGAGRARLWGTAVAVLFAAAVGVSRVYLGDHYPTDVMGSWLVVAAAAAIVWALGSVHVVRRLARRLLRDPRLEAEPLLA